MLNLEWLRTFKVIYECGSLSAAAKVLAMSQPGVGLHLNALERFTGQSLFDRDTRRMIPTDNGHRLYQSIADPLNKLEQAEQLFHSRSLRKNSSVILGTSPDLFEELLEKEVADLSFGIVLRHGDQGQLLHELQVSQIDMVITTHLGNQHNLEYKPFLKEKSFLICGQHADRKALQQLVTENDRPAMAEWLYRQNWYNAADDRTHLRNFWLTNFQEVISFKPRFVLSSFRSVLRCLEESDGFAVVPELFCKPFLSSQKIFLPWPASIPNEQMIYTVTRKKSQNATETSLLESLLIKNISSIFNADTDKL